MNLSLRERERESVLPAPLEPAPWIKVRGTMATSGAISFFSSSDIAISVSPSLDPLRTKAAAEHSEHTIHNNNDNNNTLLVISFAELKEKARASAKTLDWEIEFRFLFFFVSLITVTTSAWRRDTTIKIQNDFYCCKSKKKRVKQMKKLFINGSLSRASFL